MAATTTPADAPPGPPSAEARTPRRPRRPVWGAVGVALVLVLAGVLFAANARLQGGLDARQAQDLPSLVQAELNRAEAASAEVEALRAEVDRLTDEGTAGQPADPEAEQRSALAAGRVAVTGPGITVRLSDAAPGANRPEWATNDDLVVHQQDLQAVINALWSGGAEAMTLQDQRVISTTAFRCVGNVLLLHDRHYSPPYEVRAIGDPEQLEAALMASPTIQTYLDWVDAVGLGWSVSEEDTLDLPAYEGSLELRWAEVPEDVTASGGTSP